MNEQDTIPPPKGRALLLAATFALGILGVLGGPLALAGLLEGLIEWRGVYKTVVDFWQVKVAVPFQKVLSAPLLALGMSPVPTWVANYVAMGCLFEATRSRAARLAPYAYTGEVDRFSLSNVPLSRIPLAIPLLAIGKAALVVIWPYNLMWELAMGGYLLFHYMRVKDSWDEYEMPWWSRQFVYARLILMGLPLLLFTVAWALNVLAD